MKDFHYAERGSFNKTMFIDKITEAKKKLKEEDIAFNEIRHSLDAAYLIGNINYSGEYIIYEIRKADKVIGSLNCFLSSRNEYMEVYFQPKAQ